MVRRSSGKDYQKDGVHFGVCGMRQYFHRVRKAIRDPIKKCCIYIV